ncbi:hypothetical protein DNK63_21930 [Providencia rettgeri]|nr:hypothetical protein DNK63_21930 [Providencia rettgeri]
MGSCAAPSAKGDDKFITTDYLQQCPKKWSLELIEEAIRGFAPISPKCPTNHNYLIDFKEKPIHFFHPF